MQLVTFRYRGTRNDLEKIHNTLKKEDVQHVIYEDVMNFDQVGLLFWSDDIDFFTDKLRDMLGNVMKIQEQIQDDMKNMKKLNMKKNNAGVTANNNSNYQETFTMNMFGKTYSNGHEPNLRHHLFEKPVKN